MSMTESVFDASSFSRNRDRLLEHEVAHLFLQAVVKRARREALMSSEHFSVDGTLIEAWASRVTIGADKGYDRKAFVRECREKSMTAHEQPDILATRSAKRAGCHGDFPSPRPSPHGERGTGARPFSAAC